MDTIQTHKDPAASGAVIALPRALHLRMRWLRNNRSETDMLTSFAIEQTLYPLLYQASKAIISFQKNSAAQGRPLSVAALLRYVGHSRFVTRFALIAEITDLDHAKCLIIAVFESLKSQGLLDLPKAS